MKNEIDLARKKVVVLAASLSMYSFLMLNLPRAAVHHGVATVWVVVPLCLLAAAGMVLLLKASLELQAKKKAGVSDGHE